VRPSRRGGGRETAAGRARPCQKYSPPHRRRRARVLTDRDVRRQAHLWLLPLLASALAHAFSSKARRDLADLVLRPASERSSVTHARARFRRGTSDRHARRLLAFLDLGLTQRALTRALRELASSYVPRRPVDVAIDFHDIP
jgi:hypothetical protein